MKEDPNINLTDLVEETATELIDNKRKQIGGKVREMLLRVEQLQKDINSLTNQTNKKQKKLDTALATIAKLKAGDWSVLQEEKKEKEE